MTKNEMFAMIANAEDEALTALFGEHAEAAKELAIHALDVDAAAKARAKEKRATAEHGESDTHKANVILFKETFLPLLGTEALTTSQLAEKTGMPVGKVTPVMKCGVELGLVTAQEVKVSGRKAKAYTLAE